jgi:hypothetical protein
MMREMAMVGEDKSSRFSSILTIIYVCAYLHPN